MTKPLPFLVLAAMLLATSVNAQEVLFIIRHAEKEVTGDDPGLTQEGRARSAAWASLLGHAEIDHVITTDARRSQQTGDIIAQVLGLAQTQIAMQDAKTHSAGATSAGVAVWYETPSTNHSIRSGCHSMANVWNSAAALSGKVT
mgnify:CR=1 FL=1